MFDSTEKPFPFWGVSASTRSGRDPLAVQNSSVVIYAKMITGITNVTHRLRYNGFFCWLLTLIAKRLQTIDKTQVDNITQQIKLIRRGELLLAYVMANLYPEENGTSGSTYALNNNGSTELELARGADFENKGKNAIYWQFSYGIFGQYYIGVLTQLGLIFQPDAKHHTYRVTKEGYRLYENYQKSLDINTANIVWDAIFTGKIQKEQLKNLSSLAIHSIKSNDELLNYHKIFRQPDYIDATGEQVNHRINSLKLLMRYILKDGAQTERRDFVLAFLKNNFLRTLKRKLDVSSEELSWFLYELNELSHAAYEAFHYAILYTISDEAMPLDIVLGIIKKDYESYKSKHVNTKDVYELYDRIQISHRSKNRLGELVCNAAFLINRLNQIIVPLADQILEFAKLEDYDILHPGYAPLLLSRLDGCNEKAGSWKYIEYCLFSAINDHLKSSYSKSTIGQGLVHNYMVEDGLIWELRRTVPIRTSPRLQNALQYMEDMKWIEPHYNCYRVTETGLSILKK